MDIINIARIIGKDWISVSTEVDLENVKQNIQLCEDSLLDDFTQIKTEKENENMDRVNFQKESLLSFRNRELERRTRTLSTHELHNNKRGISMVSGQIKKLEATVRVKMEGIEKCLNFNCIQETECYGVLKVV
jgi:hypothetical protein